MTTETELTNQNSTNILNAANIFNAHATQKGVVNVATIQYQQIEQQQQPWW
jgi:hypothetical protein